MPEPTQIIDVPEYPVVGSPIPSSVEGLDPRLWRLSLEYCLQHDREAWRTRRDFPFLEVDGDVVAAKLAEKRRLVVLGSGFLIQNVRSFDARRLLMGRLFGGGLDAGLSRSGALFATGAMNPKAFTYFGFNSPLCVGEQPYLAESQWLVVVEKDGQPFQYTVAELRERNGRSYPHSTLLPLERVVELQEEFWSKYLDRRAPLQDGELEEVQGLLDRVFAANRAVHEAALLHHLREKGEPKYDHEAPQLTAFGRLVHDEEGNPAIEHNLSLLHYRKALQEFDAAKRAQRAGDVDQQVVHGVYCITALAAAIESVANKVYFVRHGEHVGKDKDRVPLERLLQEAEALAHARKRKFERLKQTAEEHEAMEAVRKIRNDFTHAVEEPVEIDPASSQSRLLSSVSVENCRRLLALTRAGLRFVLEQVPEVTETIRLDGAAIGMGELEVP